MSELRGLLRFWLRARLSSAALTPCALSSTQLAEALTSSSPYLIILYKVYTDLS